MSVSRPMLRICIVSCVFSISCAKESRESRVGTAPFADDVNVATTSPVATVAPTPSPMAPLRWQSVSTEGMPNARVDASVSSSDEWFVIWGGLEFSSGTRVSTGAKWSAANDVWTPTSAENAPVALSGSATVATKDGFIVWGGGFPLVNTGARYNAVSDSWTPLATSGAPTPRVASGIAWVNDRLVVWGGATSSTPGATAEQSGGIWNSVSNEWAPLSGGPQVRDPVSLTWKSKAIFWGGRSAAGTDWLNSGFILDTDRNVWREMPTDGAPVGHEGYKGIVVGDSLFLWGARSGAGENLAGIFDLGSFEWRSIPENSDQFGISGFSLSPMSNGVVLWGGAFGDVVGHLFDLTASKWEVLPQDVNAPIGNAMSYGAAVKDDVFIQSYDLQGVGSAGLLTR